MSINYSEKIPNNVDLATDRKLQRALEHWQPRFLDWWQEQGPNDFSANDVYLRTAVGVDSQGWASYGYVKMPDYRWGIFLADPIAERTIGFGDHYGEPVWQQVPGELRSAFRRIIVTQGDTEPASVDESTSADEQTDVDAEAILKALEKCGWNKAKAARVAMNMLELLYKA